MSHRLYHGDCLEVIQGLSFDAVFADPFDNIGLKYNQYKDRVTPEQYRTLLGKWLRAFTTAAPVVWFSFNPKWVLDFGGVAGAFLESNPDWEWKPFTQVFTFGQSNKRDCGVGHRPLWRFKHKDAPLYPDAIKVPSWRQLNGDKRAADGGCVPLDVWAFPRVTGNSKQRRSYHPTQLHEGLVERALLLTTKEGDSVCDTFAGTGTTLRVCKRINRQCTLIELDSMYCEKIEEEHGINRIERQVQSSD